MDDPVLSQGDLQAGAIGQCLLAVLDILPGAGGVQVALGEQLVERGAVQLIAAAVGFELYLLAKFLL